jgi:transcriptional regulator with XRE-family HTH domain
LISLRNIRIQREKSQDEVALAAGISQQYYSFIESGARGKKLPVPTAKRIAAVLGFDWQDFYKEDDNAETENQGS